jgi:hypothetical protein
LTPTHWRCLAALLLGALVLGACRRDEEGPRRLARADALYRELVERGVPPRDPAYEAVLTELEAVPEDSRARPEAERRLSALRALRSPLPPRPLGRPGQGEADGGHEEAHGHPVPAHPADAGS